jgi:hypothetical protein
MIARPTFTILALVVGLLAADRRAAAETAPERGDARTDPDGARGDRPFDPPRVDLTDDWARPSSTGRFHLGVEAMTDFPVAVGGQLTLEVPYGFRLTASAGALIQPYVDVVNGVIVAAGGYDERTAGVVSDTLGNALVWNVHVAWRPFGRAGFYIAGGYRQVTLGGAVDPVEVVEIATGQSPPAEVRALLQSAYQVTSTLHMVDVELGWELVIARRLTLRFALGAALTARAHTEVEQVSVDVPSQYQGVVSQATVDGITAEARQVVADYLDATYERYVFTPTVSVGLGYRFF